MTSPPDFPIHLDSREVARKALDAYRAGKLQFQNHKPKDGIRCNYAGPCAIGVSLDKGTAELFDLAYSDEGVVIAGRRLWSSHIEVFIKAGLVTSDDTDFLIDVQKGHDDLIQDREGGGQEAAFVDLLEAKANA